MKRIYTLLAFIAFTFNAFAVQVTFRVDMKGQAISPNGVRVAGSFQAAAGATGDWKPEDDNFKMKKVGTAGLYELKVNIPAGDYAFKYVNNNAWQNADGTQASEQNVKGSCAASDVSFGDRKITVPNTAAFITPIWKWDSCDLSPLSSANELSSSSVSNVMVSPNPIINEAVLTFTNATNEAHDVTMTTVNGQVVRRIEGVTSSNLVIERAELNAGMYFITIRNTKGEAVTRRVVMQ